MRGSPMKPLPPDTTIFMLPMIVDVAEKRKARV
jgi:hypothetical protein